MSKREVLVLLIGVSLGGCFCSGVIIGQQVTLHFGKQPLSIYIGLPGMAIVSVAYWLIVRKERKP